MLFVDNDDDGTSSGGGGGGASAGGGGGGGGLLPAEAGAGASSSEAMSIFVDLDYQDFLEILVVWKTDRLFLIQKALQEIKPKRRNVFG